MQLILIYLLLLWLVPVIALAEQGKWTETFGDAGFWTKENARFIAKDNAERQFGYSALRFDREEYTYELVDLEQLLDEAFPEKTDDGLIFDKKTGQYKSIQVSVGQAWDALKDDPAIVALIPMGFARTAGEPRIVGYRKIDGRLFRGLFSAANLDTILCLDDEGDPRKAEFPHQVPLLLPLNFSNQKFTYNYLEDVNAIDFTGRETRTSPPELDYYRDRLDLCPDALQVGPRVLQPRDVKPAQGAPGRLAHNVNSVASDKNTARVVMMYDWNGWVNFVRTDGESTLFDLGTLLSSDAYFDKEPDDPKRCKWGPLPPSLSCELWAVTVAAFDEAAIALRKGDDVEFWGDPNRFAPGVLVLRRNTVPPSLDEVPEEPVEQD